MAMKNSIQVLNAKAKFSKFVKRTKTTIVKSRDPQ